MQEFVELTQKERTPEVILRAMEVNRQMYIKMIEFGCYQNQIAVDLFKSAKTPDMDLIKENKRYLYRDVNYIKDKKSRLAYLNSGITPTGLSPVELLISQTNQYFQQSQLESRPIVQFQDLFTGVEFTPQQKFTAIATKHRFDQKFNLTRSWEQRRLTEVGPYCIIETPQGSKLEITNLTRYGHPGIWKSPVNKLNIRLEDIPEKFRSNTKPHELLAVAQIDDEIGEDGKPAYRKLGTVSQQSKNDYNLKPGMTTQGAKLLSLKPELTTGQTKLLFREAYTLAEEFYGSVPQEKRLALAAAAWNISASRQDDVEVARKQNDYSPNKKVSNFVFAAFPNEIVSRLEKLQFTNLKLVTLNNEANQFLDKTWNPEEEHLIEIRASHHPPGHERHVSRLVFVQDPDGVVKEFAMLEPRTGMLPIGTQAQASVFSGESYTANAAVSLPTGSAEVTIREISKFSYAAKVFNAEPITLEFGSVPVPDQTVKIKLDGQILGELDSDSVQQLKAFNYLENGKLLNLKFLSISETGNQAFVLGSSPSGNLLKINKINFYDFSGQTFDDLDYRKVTIEMPPSKIRDAVFLNGELLGVLHFKKDKDALKQLGLLKLGQLTPAQAIVQSNFSHTFLKIDPATIEYPLLWTKERERNQEGGERGECGERRGNEFFTSHTPHTSHTSHPSHTSHILQKIKERPTFLFTVPEDEKLLGMAVDNHKIETVTNWLKSQNVEFSQRPVENVIRETHRGLAVFNLVKTSLAPVTEEKMISKFGQVINSRSDYLQKVKSLPTRSPPVVIEQQVEQKALSAALPELKTPSQQSIPPDLETLPEKEKIEAIPLKENSLEYHPVVTNNDLQNWYLVADKLGKPEQYKQRVLEIAATFKEGQQLSPQALTAMSQDIQEHLYLSRLTQIAQRITTVLGESTENGSAHQVKGKIYNIYFNPERRDLIIFEKNGSVILDVHSGKVQINNVSHEVKQTFEQANIKVEQALLKVKSNHMEL